MTPRQGHESDVLWRPQAFVGQWGSDSIGDKWLEVANKGHQLTSTICVKWSRAEPMEDAWSLGISILVCSLCVRLVSRHSGSRAEGRENSPENRVE